MEEAVMEPTEAVNALEVAFRELIRLVWGDDWIAKSKVDVSRLEDKLRTEQTMRRGASVSTNLLDYTEFTELGQILLDNWSDFAPAFGKQKYPKLYVERLNNLRNAPMHSRVLLPFERDLLSGMVGDLLNMMAIYRSEKGPDMQFYPVIDSVVDSFGSESTGRSRPNVRLKVGDTVSFTCRATDPQGRELQWTGDVMQGIQRHRALPPVTGASATLTWIVEKNEVGEGAEAIIRLVSSSDFHRHGTHDGIVVFVYPVDPPN